MKRSHFFTAAAGAIATMASPAYALTVGEARVLSFTDQPLRVLIPIKAQGWEWRAMWASAQTYQHGLGLTATLYKPRGDQTEGVIEIRSKAVITEPIVDLQITFETGHRTTVHRTPILIDVQRQSVAVSEAQPAPPKNPLDTDADTRPPASVQNTPIIDVNGRTSFDTQPLAKQDNSYPKNNAFPEIQSVVPSPNEHIRSSSYVPPPEFLPASIRASQNENVPTPPSLRQGNAERTNATERNSSADAESNYTVRQGDGLYAIANKHKPALWSVDETMADIFKTNRQAFSGNSYKTLKAGTNLTFSWNTSFSAKDDQTIKKGTAFPELRTSEKFDAPTVRQEQKPTSAFTENDARVAVLRHRMLEIQQELNALQGRSTP